MAAEHDRARFVTTHWSLVLSAQRDATPQAQEALAKLCERYWYPLYGYLRRSGHSVEESQDLTQAFFARMLERRAFRFAEPERGRFRSFLLTSLKNFVANERDKELAKKRGGTTPLLSFEFDTAEHRYRIEPVDEETPDKVFLRRWALTLLDNVFRRLRAEYSTSSRERVFDQLRVFLTGEPRELSYEAAGAQLNISEGAVKVAVHRLRRRFRDVLRDEIMQTVSSPDEVDDEIRQLWAAVGR